jgi:WD40 repeat protein
VQAVRALAAGGELVFSGSDDTCVRVNRTQAVLAVLRRVLTILRCVLTVLRCVRVWNALTLECLRVLRGHQDNVRVLAVGNGFLYSGSWDKTVHAWNLQVRGVDPPAHPASSQRHPARARSVTQRALLASPSELAASPSELSQRHPARARSVTQRALSVTQRALVASPSESS